MLASISSIAQPQEELDSTSMAAKDILYFFDGEMLEVKLLEISATEIRFKKASNIRGPIYVEDKTKVFKITFGNGTHEVMNAVAIPEVDYDEEHILALAEAINPWPELSGIPKKPSDSYLNDPNFYYHQPCVLDEGATSIRRMEKASAERKTTSVRVPYYSNTSSFLVMAGDRSNVRINANSQTKIVISMEPGYDPMDLLRLVKFKVDKLHRRDRQKSRILPVSQSSASWMVGGSQSFTKNDLRFQVTHLEEDVYEIIPDNSLAPGEYAFLIDNKFYAFGIN